MKYLGFSLGLIGFIYAAGYALYNVVLGFVEEEIPRVIKGTVVAAILISLMLWFADTATRVGVAG